MARSDRRRPDVRIYILYIKMFCYGSSSASYYNMYICMSKNARNAGGCDGNVDVKPTYDIYTKYYYYYYYIVQPLGSRII